MSTSHVRNYKAELEGIKAPLGIILYLIRRDNIDIYDIPIAKITQDYLEYLDLMEEMQIDLAGEFFVLAATLMRIKVQMLLRRDDDEEDPREELVRNLLEYKRMVEAAKSFKEMEEDRSRVFTRPVPPAEKKYRGEPVLELNLFEVMRAFREVMAEFQAIDLAEIELETFTVEEKMETILTKLDEEGQVTFKELFKGSSSRLEVIVTFISLLELMKRLKVKANQETAFGELWIYPNHDAPEEPEEPDEAKVAQVLGENRAQDGEAPRLDEEILQPPSSDGTIDEDVDDAKSGADHSHQLEDDNGNESTR